LSDIFREIEEEVRRERLEKLWKQYGDYVIAAVAVLIIGVAGFELWQRYEDNRRETASAEYNAAIQLASTDPSGAAAALEKLSQTAPSGYAQLAKFAEADTLLMTGNRDKAVSIYQSIGGQGDGIIPNAARVRAAWALAEFAPRSTLESILAPLTDPKSAWRFIAGEVLAYSDYRTGNVQRAAQEYGRLAAAPDAPPQLRNRAQSMASLIRAGGEGNVGTVPPRAPPPAPPATPATPPANP
jgi:hypothetical protein